MTVSAMLAALLAAAIPAQAAIPDDNGQIGFVRNSRFITMDADGANERVLVDFRRDHGMSLFLYPTWSPDGTKIAFSGNRLDVFPPDHDDIWVMGADGSGLTNLTNRPDASDWWPVWSPDGESIAFVGASGSGGDIMVVDAEGGELRNVTGDAAREEQPTWSPDGTRIAYSRRETIADQAEIYAIRVDGSEATNLTNSPESESSPVWSPDGTELAFVRTHPTVDMFDIWVMDADGSNVRNLTNDTTMSASQPAWSPDGARIAFAAHGPIRFSSDPDVEPYYDPPNDIFVMQRDGTDVTQLTTTPDWDSSPVWQPLPGLHRVGLVDPDTGRWHLRDQGTVRSFFYGDPGDVPFLGDWDCDGEDTPGLYRQSDGFVYLRNSNSQGNADIRFVFGDPGDVPVAGDFDGDGCDTVGLYRPSEGRVYIHNQLGSEGKGLGKAELSYFFGDPGDSPFSGDFDGDGIDTIGLHRESTGLVYFRNSHTQGNADSQFVFGDPGDRFVAGDWTEDGSDTAGLFRPSDTKFYFRNTNTQGNADAVLLWGDTHWLAVAGDFALD